MLFTEIDVYLPSFSSHAFVELAGRITSDLAVFTDIEIVFRASSADGLLLYSSSLPWPWTRDFDLDPWRHAWFVMRICCGSPPWPSTRDLQSVLVFDLHRSLSVWSTALYYYWPWTCDLDLHPWLVMREGLLLYSGYTGEQNADFISLSVTRQGYVEFRFSLGTGSTTIRSVFTTDNLYYRHYTVPYRVMTTLESSVVTGGEETAQFALSDISLPENFFQKYKIRGWLCFWIQTESFFSFVKL